ncbi:SGNH/GDSL hydrolase family protein [Nocardia sp. NPDC050710]|uniref:SGNH/GDSL hydrolase family protein n=1 Tax=Nocardia sp. NPDC050710 TaxID=3157220 RepID=UPI0034088BC0
MPIAIQNLIILGDSLSDIGIKREAPTGMFARAAGKMRTNEAGRFSDGKNWTDYLIEWMGGENLVRGDAKNTKRMSEPHQTLTLSSMVLRTDRGGNRPVLYANYAEGGAIAASDWKPKAGALGYLKDEAAKYIAARKALGGDYYGPTLHIIWIGLNDLITAQRAAGINMYAEDEIFEVGFFDRNKRGTGIEPIVQEIKDVIDSIGNAFPTTRDTDHYVLIDLPSPTVSIRFQDKIADGKVRLLNKFEKNTQHFNDLLESIVTTWPAAVDGTPGAKHANVSLVRMSDWMNWVSANAEAFELIPTAQLPGVPVLYGGQQDHPPMPLRRALTTSDLAHPTQAVYQLIARKIADHLVTRYTIGWLDAETWRSNRPYPNVNP